MNIDDVTHPSSFHTTNRQSTSKLSRVWQIRKGHMISIIAQYPFWIRYPTNSERILHNYRITNLSITNLHNLGLWIITNFVQFLHIYIYVCVCRLLVSIHFLKYSSKNLPKIIALKCTLLNIYFQDFLRSIISHGNGKKMKNSVSKIVLILHTCLHIYFSCHYVTKDSLKLFLNLS